MGVIVGHVIWLEDVNELKKYWMDPMNELPKIPREEGREIRSGGCMECMFAKIIMIGDEAFSECHNKSPGENGWPQILLSEGWCGKDFRLVHYDTILHRRNKVGGSVGPVESRISTCCRAPIEKINERGEGRHYVYDRICSKCKKPAEVTYNA